MIVFHYQWMVYLHAPRTGGTALSRLVQQGGVAGAHWVGGPYPLEHMTVDVARALFPEHPFLCVVRNPWEVVRSYYGFSADCHQHPEYISAWASRADYELVASRYQLGFTEYVQRLVAENWLDCGPERGYSRKYADERTTILRYEERPYERMAEILGVPLRLTRENVSPALDVTWDARSVELVREYFAADVERFGYQPPETLT